MDRDRLLPPPPRPAVTPPRSATRYPAAPTGPAGPTTPSATGRPRPTTPPGGTDSTTGYTYNGNGSGQPDTLTSTSTTGGSTGTAYSYDADGDMTSRTAPGTGTQTLNWSDDGRLTSITGGTAGSSSFVYDADGTVLLQKDPTNTTLPARRRTHPHRQHRHRRPGLHPARRRYRRAHRRRRQLPVRDRRPARHQRPRSGQHRAEPQLAPVHPLRSPRGTTTSWVDNRGFLNAPNDTSTGLTILGAREYDPTTGRFISPTRLRAHQPAAAQRLQLRRQQPGDQQRPERPVHRRVQR
ncbi:hypothetical protein GXW82_11940 [Streptacidiphilus sp. 4-A2]|nr:hypothetical protein [Streptacidiphilus sp. 4-A2]